MGWAEHHRRQRVIAEAARGVPFDDIPGITEFFQDQGELLQALRYRWNLLLQARMELAEVNGRDPGVAWHELASDEPVLHDLVRRHTG